jgi:predicted ABC-class ATPase
VRGLWGSLGVSTVLVLGGSGDYFDVADTVLMLDEYRCADVIERGLWVLPLLMGY